jgi:hypothetical protein
MSTPGGTPNGRAIDLNGTGISMYPDPAGQMMTDIANVLTNLWDTWTATNGKIESLEGKIGDGPMGEPVKKDYDKAVKQLREIITSVVANLSHLSEAGTKAVPMYIKADLKAGQHFEF